MSNIVKNMLRAFKNEEQAELKLTYCAIDNEFTGELSYTNLDGTNGITIETDENVDRVLGALALKVYESRGEI